MTETSADGFGSLATGLRKIDPTTGLAYELGIGPDVDGVPTVVWQLVSTWAVAKARLGPSWADAKRRVTTWGQGKAIVGT